MLCTCSSVAVKVVCNMFYVPAVTHVNSDIIYEVTGDVAEHRMLPSNRGTCPHPEPNSNNMSRRGNWTPDGAWTDLPFIGLIGEKWSCQTLAGYLFFWSFIFFIRLPYGLKCVLHMLSWFNVQLVFMLHSLFF